MCTQPDPKPLEVIGNIPIDVSEFYLRLLLTIKHVEHLSEPTVYSLPHCTARPLTLASVTAMDYEGLTFARRRD